MHCRRWQQFACPLPFVNDPFRTAPHMAPFRTAPHTAPFTPHLTHSHLVFLDCSISSMAAQGPLTVGVAALRRGGGGAREGVAARHSSRRADNSTTRGGRCPAAWGHAPGLKRSERRHSACGWVRVACPAVGCCDALRVGACDVPCCWAYDALRVRARGVPCCRGGVMPWGAGMQRQTCLQGSWLTLLVRCWAPCCGADCGGRRPPFVRGWQ